MSAWLSAARRFVFLLPMLVSLAVHAGDGTCVRTQADVCVEGPGTRNISGLDVYRDCWRYEAKFSCQSANYVDDCKPLVDRGCTNIATQCINTTGNPPGCQLWEQTYRCQASGGVPKAVTHCDTQSFCTGGSCFDSGHPPDTDFATVIASLEAGREAGHYKDCMATGTCQFFKGYDNRCSVKLFGLKSCCSPSPAGASSSNFALLGNAFNAGKEVADLGSGYVYDALFNAEAPQWLTEGLGALLGTAGFDGAFNPTFSYYGFSASFGGATALPAGSTALVDSGTFVVGFDPTTFAIAVAIYVVMEMTQCEQDEQILAVKKGQRLCHAVGSYCASKVLGACVTKKETYCCFNSRLARLINEQGRTQVGRAWGEAKSPDCSGFSMAELQALDLSRMDLAEFYAEIAPTLPDLTRLQDKASAATRNYVGKPQ